MGTAKQYLAAAKSVVAGSGVHYGEHENTKVAGSIIKDILDHFALAPLPILEIPDRKLKPPKIQKSLASSKTKQTASGQNKTNAEHELRQSENKADDVSGSTQSNVETPQISPHSPPSIVQPRLPPFVAPPPPTAADARDLVSATVQTFHEILQADAGLYAQRAAFITFWQLVRLAHPVPACRTGAEALLENLNIWWPQGASELWKPPKDMLEHDICGSATEAPGVAAAQPYHTCLGSKPEYRGYTCGMWMLFHALAAGCAPVCLLLDRWPHVAVHTPGCRGGRLALKGMSHSTVVSFLSAVRSSTLVLMWIILDGASCL
jgi:hypothetical protein